MRSHVPQPSTKLQPPPVALSLRTLENGSHPVVAATGTGATNLPTCGQLGIPHIPPARLQKSGRAALLQQLCSAGGTRGAESGGVPACGRHAPGGTVAAACRGGHARVLRLLSSHPGALTWHQRPQRAQHGPACVQQLQLHVSVQLCRLAPQLQWVVTVVSRQRAAAVRSERVKALVRGAAGREGRHMLWFCVSRFQPPRRLPLSCAVHPRCAGGWGLHGPSHCGRASPYHGLHSRGEQRQMKRYRSGPSHGQTQ